MFLHRRYNIYNILKSRQHQTIITSHALHNAIKIARVVVLLDRSKHFYSTAEMLTCVIAVFK